MCYYQILRHGRSLIRENRRKSLRNYLGLQGVLSKKKIIIYLPVQTIHYYKALITFRLAAITMKRSRSHRSRRPRTNLAAVRRLVERVSGETIVHRYATAGGGVSIAANTTTNFPLLGVSDTADYALGGNFSTACQTQKDSRITAIRLRLMIQSSATTNMFRFMLVLNKGGNFTADATLMWQNTVTATAQSNLIRKYCLTAGSFIIANSTQLTHLPLFIRKAALHRIGHISENDALQLWIHNSHATLGGLLFGTGRIYTKEA